MIDWKKRFERVWNNLEAEDRIKVNKKTAGLIYLEGILEGLRDSKDTLESLDVPEIVNEILNS